MLTDSTGGFFLRTKKAKEMSLKVLSDQFITPGFFEVVSAPGTVKADREELAGEVIIIIIVRRVSRPKGAETVASQGASGRKTGGQ